MLINDSTSGGATSVRSSYAPPVRGTSINSMLPMKLSTLSTTPEAMQQQELEEEDVRQFIGCLSLQIGVRILAVIDTTAFILLVTLAILDREETDDLSTLMIYSLMVFGPGIVCQICLEVGGQTQAKRKYVMISAWYSAGASLLVNIFIIGYVILYNNCQYEDDGQSSSNCTDGIRFGAVLFLMILQAILQVYLAMVTTWYYKEFAKDQQERIHQEDKKKALKYME